MTDRQMASPASSSLPEVLSAKTEVPRGVPPSHYRCCPWGLWETTSGAQLVQGQWEPLLPSAPLISLSGQSLQWVHLGAA